MTKREKDNTLRQIEQDRYINSGEEVKHKYTKKKET